MKDVGGRLLVRRKLPDNPLVQKRQFKIANIHFVLMVYMYENGGPGEVTLTVSAKRSVLAPHLEAWARAISMEIQFGIPLPAIVQEFRGFRAEPSGFTGDPAYEMVTSPQDYVVRWLERHFMSPPALVIMQEETRPTPLEPSGTK